MNLAHALTETNDLLREFAKPKKEQTETPVPFNPRKTAPTPLRSSELMLTIPGIGGILREHFREVPAEYIEQGEDGARTVSCLCSEKTTIPAGALHECSCGRIFWNGITLSAAPPAPEDDVQVCDICCRRVRASQGALALIADIEGFLCHECEGS